MSELLEFIEARLQDDEQAASQCVERDWSFSGSNCHVLAERSANGSFRTIAWCANGYDDDFSNSIHIANYDPARALREVQSKRRALARHHRDRYGVCVGCGWSGNLDEARIDATEECPELLDMASVWSDHPAYRPEWSLDSVVPES